MNIEVILRMSAKPYTEKPEAKSKTCAHPSVTTFPKLSSTKNKNKSKTNN